MCVATEEGSGLGAELAGIRVPRDRWVLDKKALETGEPEEAQEPREATKGEASGSKSHSEDAAGAPEATSSKGETKAVDKSGVSQDKPPPEAAVKEEPAVAVKTEAGESDRNAVSDAPRRAEEVKPAVTKPGQADAVGKAAPEGPKDAGAKAAAEEPAAESDSTSSDGESSSSTEPKEAVPKAAPADRAKVAERDPEDRAKVAERDLADRQVPTKMTEVAERKEEARSTRNVKRAASPRRPWKGTS